jgi:hypothetical protein
MWLQIERFWRGPDLLILYIYFAIIIDENFGNAYFSLLILHFNSSFELLTAS